MKIAKSYKIIFLITAFVLSIATAFGVMNTTNTYADTSVSSYFSGSTSKASFNDTGLVMTSITSSDKLSFKNDLVLNDLTLELELPSQLTTVITVKADSFYVNGNPKVDGETTTYEKEIVNTVKLVNGDTVKCSVNGGAEFDIDLTDGLQFAIEGNYLTVNGEGVPEDQNALNYYKLKNIDNRAIAEYIEISFEGENTTNQTFALKSVDQKRGEQGYKQSLTTEGLKEKANPRASLNDSFYTRIDADGNYKAIKVAMGDYETVTFTAYSVLGNTSDLVLVNHNDGVDLELNTDKPKKVCFDKAGDITFGVGKDGVAYEEFAVEVKAHDFEEEENDAKAPKYIKDEIALASFENALKEKITKKDDDGNVTSASLGTTLELPSFEDLVYDDVVSYTNLKKTVYYRTVKTSSNSSSLKFSLDSIGNYMFYVVFSDGVNTMETTNFYEEQDDGSVVYNEYEQFIFKFEIKDDAPINVTAAKEQGAGYKGIKYKASSFTVEASGCTTTYKLYYNEKVDAKEDANGWKEIPASSSVKESEYNGDTFTYDEVKEINYDGNLTFVPTRLGAYKIVCTVSSDVSQRTATDFTIVKVESEPSTVIVPSEWIKNNTWSVVFLSVGTLCLIGIIILLCIKPKDEIDND